MVLLFLAVVYERSIGNPSDNNQLRDNSCFYEKASSLTALSPRHPCTWEDSSLENVHQRISISLDSTDRLTTLYGNVHTPFWRNNTGKYKSRHLESFSRAFSVFLGFVLFIERPSYSGNWSGSEAAGTWAAPIWDAGFAGGCFTHDTTTLSHTHTPPF